MLNYFPSVRIQFKVHKKMADKLAFKYTQRLSIRLTYPDSPLASVELWDNGKPIDFRTEADVLVILQLEQVSAA